MLAVCKGKKIGVDIGYCPYNDYNVFLNGDALNYTCLKKFLLRMTQEKSKEKISSFIDTKNAEFLF